MANAPADTYWEVDGTSLQTYAMNISTLGGGRDSVPTWRGDNSEVAYRRGGSWRQKTPEQRVITLAMWVQGTDSNGNVTGMGQRAQFRENIRAIKQLFWNDRGVEVALKKKWLHTDGTTVKSATAQAQLVNDLAYDMQGEFSAVIAVDLLLADPFFYGVEVTQAVPYQTTPWTSFVAEGDAITNKVKLEFNGALTNPTLTLSDPTPDVFVTAGVNIIGGDKLTLDCDLYTAIRTSDSANLIGVVAHSGSRQWMFVQPGTNTMLLTGSAGSGTCSVKYQPAFW